MNEAFVASRLHSPVEVVSCFSFPAVAVVVVVRHSFLSFFQVFDSSLFFSLSFFLTSKPNANK